MYLFIIITILFIIFLNWATAPDPKPIHGVYSQPGKWFSLKFWIFYIILALRKRQSEKGETTGKDAGFGKKSRNSIEDMDRVQELPAEHPTAVDAVYFNGAGKDEQYFVAATARRHQKLTQTILLIQIPEVGLLQHTKMPDTNLYRDEDMSYSADGLYLTPVTPMKKWKLTYRGKLRLVRESKEDELLDATFDLDWDADTAMFDFDTDLHPYNLCNSVAREKWSRKLFDTLKAAHQTHYEQFGTISGKLTLEKYGEKEILVRGVRDHSYGNHRDWKDLHRYTLQYGYLEDGTAICTGVICMHISLTRLVIGYVFHPDGRMDTVSWTDMELWKLGDDGNDPDDCEVNFIAGGKDYKLSMHVVGRPEFYMGSEGEARVVERFCTWTVNGQKGWGVSEWDYRDYSGKTKST